MVKVEIDEQELEVLKRKAARLAEFEEGLENHLGAYNEETDEFEESDADVCSVGEYTLNFFDAWR